MCARNIHLDACRCDSEEGCIGSQQTPEEEATRPLYCVARPYALPVPLTECSYNMSDLADLSRPCSAAGASPAPAPSSASGLHLAYSCPTPLLVVVHIMGLHMCIGRTQLCTGLACRLLPQRHWVLDADLSTGFVLPGMRPWLHSHFLTDLVSIRKCSVAKTSPLPLPLVLLARAPIHLQAFADQEPQMTGISSSRYTAKLDLVATVRTAQPAFDCAFMQLMRMLGSH